MVVLLLLLLLAEAHWLSFGFLRFLICHIVIDKNVQKHGLGCRWIVDVSRLSVRILLLELDCIVKEPFTVPDTVLDLGRVRALRAQLGALLARLLFISQDVAFPARLPRSCGSGSILTPIWLFLELSGH